MGTSCRAERCLLSLGLSSQVLGHFLFSFMLLFGGSGWSSRTLQHMRFALRFRRNYRLCTLRSDFGVA